MATLRKPFQGVRNVVRFNWHFYLFAALFLSLILLFGFFIESFRLYSLIIFFVALTATLVSLAATVYVYDLSGLYRLNWLEDYDTREAGRIININAGFDETSELLKERFPNSEMLVFDFYNPRKHTEMSISRARKAYPPYTNTLQIETTKIPLPEDSAKKIFAVLSAHEIRSQAERDKFFNELHRILKPDGRVFVVEHLRDTANFLAYNIGFFHFYSRTTWLENFRAANFAVEREIKITPFITTFVLKKS